jgi:hypothetical protein
MLSPYQAVEAYLTGGGKVISLTRLQRSIAQKHFLYEECCLLGCYAV